MAAEATANRMPEDERRSLLTEREKEILAGEADVSEKYFYVVVSRVRKKVQGLEEDMEFLNDHYDDLSEELHEVVCDDE